MSLSEFKSLPFPDPDSKLNTEQPMLVCNGDGSEGKKSFLLLLSDADKQIGTVKCQWSVARKYSSYLDGAWITVGRGNAKEVIYSFVKTPESSEPLLFNVSIRMNSLAFPSLVDGLTEKFGKPSDTQVIEVKNKVGNSFNSAIAKWENESSSIRLEERYLKIDELGLSYIHKALSGYYYKEKESRKEPAKL